MNTEAHNDRLEIHALGAMIEEDRKAGRWPRQSVFTWIAGSFAVLVLLLLLQFQLYRPDDRNPGIVPGSSSSPSFQLQIIRPRAGLPLAGIAPPELFGVDAKLEVSSLSNDARYSLSKDSLDLAAGDWEVHLEFDGDGNLLSDCFAEFPLIFENERQRIRCAPADSPIGRWHFSRVKQGEYSGSFELELPHAVHPNTNAGIGWPPRPLVLVGSFDRLSRAEELQE